jgi:hypothetical protein
MNSFFRLLKPAEMSQKTKIKKEFDICIEVINWYYVYYKNDVLFAQIRV